MAPRRVVLAIAALALGLGLCGAATASAAEWEIGEMPLSSSGISGETLSSSGGTFELTVPSSGLTIHCTAESGSGEIVKGGAGGKATLELSGCTVSKFEKACSVKSTGKSTGVIAMTASTKFFETEVKEVEKGYEELTPTTTVEITGAECKFASKLEMSGATAAETSKLEEENTKRVWKLSKAIGEESGVTSLKLGKNQAFLIGEDKESLSGSHKEEALAVTEVVITPPFLIFENRLSPTTVIIENLGPENIVVTEIKVESGAFEAEDPEECKESHYAPDEECVFAAQCTTLPSVGNLLIQWAVLNGKGTAVSFGKRRPTASCGVA
jgi:hypothetical protein